MSDKTTPYYLAGLAVITGLFAGAATLAIAYLAHWSSPWALALVAFTLSSAATWLGLLGWWRSVVERIHRIERPAPPPEPYNFETRLTILTGVDNTEGIYLDIPLSRDRLIEVAARLARGAEFSHASLSGRYRPLSRSEYESLRDLFLSRGLVRWKDPRSHNLGLELSRPGRAAMHQLVRSGDIPILQAGLHEEVQEV